MAQTTTEPLFNVTNGPGPYKLLKEYMAMLDEHKKPIVQLDLPARAILQAIRTASG